MAPSFSILSRRMISMSIGSLLHDVGEEAEMARALDRLGELALLLGRDGGDAAGNDLAALRDEALEQADVLIVDAGGVLAGKGAGLAAAEKGACHDVSSFSLSVGEVGTGGAVAAIRTVAARAAITAVATITTVAALAVAVAAPHHRGGAGLVLVDADRHVTDDVLVDLGLALELGDDAGRSFEIEHHVMTLAVLGDAVGEGAQAPGLGLGDRAAVRFDDVGGGFRQRVDLGLGEVLARDEDMLVERHVSLSFSFGRSLTPPDADAPPAVVSMQPGRKAHGSRPGGGAHSRSAAFRKPLARGPLARDALEIAGHLQMVAEHRQLGAGEVRGPAVAGARLGLEQGDRLAVRIDVERRQLAVKGAAGQALEPAHLGAGLRQRADGRAQAVAAEQGGGGGLRGAVVGLEHAAHVARRRRAAPRLGEAAELDLAIVGEAGGAQEGGRRGGEGGGRGGGAEQSGGQHLGFHPKSPGGWSRGPPPQTGPAAPGPPALTPSPPPPSRPPRQEDSRCARSFSQGRAARRSAWARRWPKPARSRASCSRRSTRRSARI